MTTNKQRWVLVLCSIASLMVALDVTVVSTALSTIRHDLGASINELEWTVNAYTLSFAVLLITASALGDRLGRRRLFAAGLALFAAASAACALSPNVGLLIAARAVQGAGGAMIAPLSLTLLGTSFPPERRGWALGIYSGITGIAVLAGPVIGGAVTQGLAWQWIFWLNVPIGLVAIPFVLTRLQESFGPRARLDVIGLALVTGAAFGVVWGLMRGNAAGWGSLEVVVSLAAGVILTALFVAFELRTSEPMLPMRLFSSRSFSAGSTATFLQSCALFGAVFFMTQFQQVSLGQGPLDTGLRLLPWTGTVFVVAPAAGKLADQIGNRPLVVLGLTQQALGFAWIAAIAKPDLAYWQMIGPMILAGAGISMSIPGAQNAVIGAVGAGEIGKASGTSTMMRQLGGVFGVAVAVAVFSGAGSYASPAAFASGFTPAMAVAAGLSLAGALTATLIPRRRQVRLAVASASAG